MLPVIAFLCLLTSALQAMQTTQITSNSRSSESDSSIPVVTIETPSSSPTLDTHSSQSSSSQSLRTQYVGSSSPRYTISRPGSPLKLSSSSGQSSSLSKSADNIRQQGQVTKTPLGGEILSLCAINRSLPVIDEKELTKKLNTVQQVTKEEKKFKNNPDQHVKFPHKKSRKNSTDKKHKDKK